MRGMATKERKGERQGKVKEKRKTGNFDGINGISPN
jgi:hypothetical protein